MQSRDLLSALITASKVEQVRDALEAYRKNPTASESPFGGRANNRGAIEVATDAARSAIERVTNAQDALLELEHLRHGGKPDCRSPREAAEAWLGVPLREGLSGLSTRTRQELSWGTILRLEPGEGAQSRILTVADRGIGIRPERMKDTILSLNESNKIQKHYLAGTYGQGGSSTLAFSKFTLIASRAFNGDQIGFTVVWYEDLPAEDYKTGRYVYLVNEDDVPTVTVTSDGDFPHGTIIRHFGFDLSGYAASIGPKSMYGALQRVLFDPVTPIRFENQLANWNRTIKGSRNALNGAVDQGDESFRGPELDYSVPIFNVSLGDYGSIGIEYWVLARPDASSGKKVGKPSRAFVDDAKPIVLTHNGQNHDELSGTLIKKDADLPFLQTQGRLIVHVNCDHLSPTAKRLLFSSTREQSREGFLKNTIVEEIVRLLKSDDELKRLNEKAREESLKEKDAEAEKQMQKQVARLLRIVGTAIAPVGGTSGGGESPPPRPPGPLPKPKPIDTKEPPTYIKIVGDPNEAIAFYGDQRRYVRLETDANSDYHDPHDPSKSRINIIVGDDLKIFGTSPLRGGRMRVGVQCKTDVALDSKGSIRVELYRSGLPPLSDERSYLVVEPPKPTEGSAKTTFPKFKVIPVDGVDDPDWVYVNDDLEDRDFRRHASGTQMNDGVLYIYYSTAFPRFVVERNRFEQQGAALSASFQLRYELWLAVHALLVHQDEEDSDFAGTDMAEYARQERCRLASIAAMVASQEVRSGVNTEDAEEAA